MNYLLDANVCIAVMNQSSDRVRWNLKSAKLSGAQLYISSVVVHELWFGVANSRRVQGNASVLRKFLARGLKTLDFSNEDAKIAGEIRASLKAAGTPIGAYDTLIAGQTLARGLTLVTANTGEFARVGGLKIVDWTL